MLGLAADRRTVVRIGLAASTLASTGGMASLARAVEPRPGAAVDPVAFFTGRTEGTGSLDEIAASRKAMRCVGVGAVRAGELFVLDQTVEIAGEPTKRRQWQLRQTAPGQYGGTISDARGPVTIAVAGNRMRIAYTMKDGGMRVESVLTLASDGRSAVNSTKIRKFGFVVATLDETIRKV